MLPRRWSPPSAEIVKFPILTAMGLAVRKSRIQAPRRSLERHLAQDTFEGLPFYKRSSGQPWWGTECSRPGSQLASQGWSCLPQTVHEGAWGPSVTKAASWPPLWFLFLCAPTRLPVGYFGISDGFSVGHIWKSSISPGSHSGRHHQCTGRGWDRQSWRVAKDSPLQPWTTQRTVVVFSSLRRWREKNGVDWSA